MVEPLRRSASPVRVEAGWLMTPYYGIDTAVVELGAAHPSQRMPATWQPAFLSSYEGQRVAQVRPDRFGIRGPVVIWQRVNGTATAIGTATL